MSNMHLTDNDKKPITGEFTDATPLLATPERLRASAKEDGMLFFRGMLPRQEVLAVRHDILAILDRHNLLDRNYPADEAMVNAAEANKFSIEEISWNGVGVTMDVYREVQKLESFHALAHHPKLLAMYGELFEERVFVHPRHIGRVMLPHPGTKVTPSHQDFLHIQGAESTWTCWVPLGDVPRSLGGLAVLKGSHQAGLLGVVNAPGAGGLETILCGLDYEWATVDYEAGDVLTFHSHTVHKSTPNQQPGKIRMSADFRYQAASAPIEGNSLLPHGPYAWDELYEGWSRKDLQYYWRQEKFELTPFDESIRWQKDKIC